MAETTTTQTAEDSTTAIPKQAGAAAAEQTTPNAEHATPEPQATAEEQVEVRAEAEPAITVEPLPSVPGFEELTQSWWTAVTQVHQVLLLEDADLDTVTMAFNTELMARWEYAKALHERGFQVPDYLAERTPVAPLWPQPQPPAHLSQLAKAA